jgi:hypothetical protein
MVPRAPGNPGEVVAQALCAKKILGSSETRMIIAGSFSHSPIAWSGAFSELSRSWFKKARSERAIGCGLRRWTTIVNALLIAQTMAGRDDVAAHALGGRRLHAVLTRAPENARTSAFSGSADRVL